MAIKTLLIGLGGTGCEIVSRVKKRIGAVDPNVQFLGFDTDGEWEGTDGLDVIYTGREMTVRQYLEDVEGWQTWFPDNASIMQKNMLKGAGQVRPLSRLAFAETIASRRLSKLDEAIKQLKLAKGEISPSNFRVMIVSSFAGGTGSGMFLQTALFLRKYIRKNYSSEILIRGMFALPDMFMECDLNDNQRESMYANAYAALKELSAINQVCLTNDASADSINMQIDDLFNSKTARLDAKQKPFDFIFFVDTINSNGEVMQSLEEYKNLITEATYMQVYSPVTPIGDSREDNLILTVIAGDGKPLYGGVGAAKIVYPYEDIVSYCGMRATVESISNVWGMIDNEFYKDDAENKKQMARDLTTVPIERNEHFITTVNKCFEDDVARLKFIREALVSVSEDGSKIPRADIFFDNVIAYIEGKIKSNAELKTLSNAAGLQKNIKPKDLKNSVENSETALSSYYEAINAYISVSKSGLIQSIFPDELPAVKSTLNEFNIMWLVTLNDNIVHPLSVRMLLYTLQKKMKRYLDEVKHSSIEGRNKIKDYFKKAYDIASTKDVVETASDRASEKGFFKKRGFAKLYARKSMSIKKSMDTYAVEALTAAVLEGVYSRLNALIAQYERLFDNLENITRQLNGRIDAIENNKAHTSPIGESTYVCAHPEMKKEIYESLHFNTRDDNENPIYGSIYKSLYKNSFDEAEKAGSKLDRSSQKKKEAEAAARMSDLFIDNVLKKNIEDISLTCSDKLDIDIYEALKKETGGDTEQIERIIASTFSKGAPYLKHNTRRSIVSLSNINNASRDSSYVLTFWGISPDVKENILLDNAHIHDIKTFFRAGSLNMTPEVVISDMYSKHEISCYEALYCVELKDIPKFLETGDSFGVFYENYKNRVDQMVSNDQSALTPHLDIRWHNRRYLPMISEGKNREDDARAARALWLALIYGGLPEETVGKKKYFFAAFLRYKNGRPVPEQVYPNSDILYNDKRVESKNYYELYKALQFDDITVRRFIEVYEPAFEEDRQVGMGRVELRGPRARKLARKLAAAETGKVSERNALQAIYRFVSHAMATEYEKDVFIGALNDLIGEFCADMPSGKESELRSLIYAASGLAKNKAAKTATERYISVEAWDLGTDEE
ncbi:MAG: hypothetical protein IKP47_02295 [Ruminococcus sp.]|nr:hypothetical protein [Ruminococcus sp.]